MRKRVKRRAARDEGPRGRRARKLPERAAPLGWAMCRADGKTPSQAASAANGANGAKRQKAPREVCLPDEVLSLVRSRSGGSLARAGRNR